LRVGLRLAEQFGHLAIAVTIGVLNVVLEPERVVEALFGEPNEVVILVFGAGHLTGFGGCGHLPPPFSSIAVQWPPARRVCAPNRVGESRTPLSIKYFGRLPVLRRGVGAQAN
jgi:hypothetical protein